MEGKDSMNPEDPPKINNPEDEASSPGEAESALEPADSEAAEELNAIAKALMVKILWSQVGLLDEETP